MLMSIFTLVRVMIDIQHIHALKRSENDSSMVHPRWLDTPHPPFRAGHHTTVALLQLAHSQISMQALEGCM